MKGTEMKKATFLLMSILIISIISTSCGPAATPLTVEVTRIVEGTPIVEKVAVTATPEPEKQVTLKLWTVEAGREAYDIAHRNAIAAFEEQHPNIKIELVKIGFVGFQDVLTSAILANQAPDVVELQSAWAQQYIQLGALLPVTDIVQAIGEDQYGKAEKIAFSKDGEWYGVPFFGFPHVVWYRTDIFNEKGLTPPSTWDEMLAVAQELTEDTDGDGKVDRYGLLTAMSTTDQDFSLMFGTDTNNTYWLDGDGNPIVVPGTDNYDRFVESLAYIKKLKTCCMPDGVLTWTQEDTRYGFLNGDAAMLVSSTGFALTILGKDPEFLDVVSTIPWPYNSANPDAQSNNYWGGYCDSVLATSAHPEEARLFVEFLHQYDIELKWFQDSIIGWLPSRKEIVESDDLWNSERWAGVAPTIRVGGSYAATHGQIPGMQLGSNKWASVFFDHRLYAQLWNKLIAEDLTPDQAAQWMQAEMERIIASE